MKQIILIFTIFMLMKSIFAEEELPPYLKVCHRDIPDLEKCMIDSVNILKPYLKEGIPELDAPKIDPIYIGDLIISGKANLDASNGLVLTANNVTIYESSNFIVKKIKTLNYGRKYNFKIMFPKLKIVGNYAMDGSIILIRLKSDGKFRADIKNGLGDVTATMVPVQRDGKTFIEIKRIQIKITVGGGRMKLDNIFKNSKELSDIVNEAINNNFIEYSKEIIPFMEKSLEQYFLKVSNKIIGKFTEDQLYPK